MNASEKELTLNKDFLKQVVLDQQADFRLSTTIIPRNIDIATYLIGNETIVISGMRRCGKSTLMKIFSNRTIKENQINIYINFNDIRLVDFTVDDFFTLENLPKEIYGVKKSFIFYFDEIQNIPYWHRWVNNLNDKGIKVFVTGSNSNLLSSEISTFLTGRHKVIELSPFNFHEFLNFKKVAYNKELSLLTTDERINLLNHFRIYLENGGMPQVLINDDIAISKQIFEDILIKDIVVRKQIREVKEFKDVVLYLLSNIAAIYSYSTLKNISGIKSLSTIKNYIDSLKETFLMSSLPRFSYSLKKQKVSSSKIFCQDNIFLKTVAFNFSQNLGKRIENLVHIELKRRKLELYYHLESQECDFIVKTGTKITNAIQVTLSLDNEKTKDRELKGLIEAMNAYNLNSGLIITENEETEFDINGKKIKIIPCWKWLLDK